jgi:aminoglycoside phosphotransferase (APT) family kinase protein
MDPIRRWVERLAAEPMREASIERKALGGGLEAPEVALVTARYRDSSNRARMLRFVVKRLEGRAVREAAVYQRLAATYATDVSPRLFGVEHAEGDRALLCIEAVRRVRAWPWRDLSIAGELLARLARFHAAAAEAAPEVPEWDYEAELRILAEATRTTVDRCRLNPDLSALARGLPPLDRIVLALPRFRSQLLSERPFARAPIHGDVHTGNALVRRRGRGDEPVLLDWGRARTGSPLEDVSSWLQSLGFWEQAARRYHDTLFSAYLSAFGMERKLTAQIRAAYWMAGASNALAGPLLHHLSIVGDERQSASRRAAAFQAARDWLRVVRRADAWWS